MAILLQATTTLADLLHAPSSPLASVSSFSAVFLFIMTRKTNEG
jgi:hypothetical protein